MNYQQQLFNLPVSSASLSTKPQTSRLSQKKKKKRKKDCNFSLKDCYFLVLVHAGSIHRFHGQGRIVGIRPNGGLRRRNPHHITWVVWGERVSVGCPSSLLLSWRSRWGEEEGIRRRRYQKEIEIFSLSSSYPSIYLSMASRFYSHDSIVVVGRGDVSTQELKSNQEETSMSAMRWGRGRGRDSPMPGSVSMISLSRWICSFDPITNPPKTN